MLRWRLELGILGRSMKRASVGLVAMGALLALPAMAADMPVKAPVVRAPVVAWNWTGCFVGGNVGGVWVKSDFTAAPPDPVQSLGGHDASSVIGGVQGGCDYQVGRWVFGIQGDFDWTSARGQHPSIPAPNFLIRSRAKSLASVTARVGYTWDRFLGYVRGGGAWERNEFDTIFIPTGVLFDWQKGPSAAGPSGLAANTRSTILFPGLPSTTTTISETTGSRSSRLPARRPSMPTSASASTSSKSVSTRGGAGRPQSPRDTD